MSARTDFSVKSVSLPACPGDENFRLPAEPVRSSRRSAADLPPVTIRADFRKVQISVRYAAFKRHPE